MVAQQHILITGANGLLGYQALTAWRGQHVLHAVVRAMPADPVPEVTYHVRDLAAAWDEHGLPKRIDAVCHLAQSTQMRDFPTAADDIFRVNTQATAHLLGYAQRVGARRFILASTGGLYAATDALLTSQSPVAPRFDTPLGYYFASKLAAENLAQAYAGLLQVTLVRPFFIYGERQPAAMLVPRLIGNVRHGTAIKLRGGTGTRLNPIAATDAAAALTAVLIAPDAAGVGILNLAGSEILTIKAMAEQIGAGLGRVPVFDIEPGVADTIIADSAPLQALLGKPLTGFTTGMAAMLR
jgi:nucleoside-diphosphate-sugar epimerase